MSYSGLTRVSIKITLHVMLLVLSPSKTLDFDTPHPKVAHTQPQFLADSEKLVAKLRTFSRAQIVEMMELSEKLAALNVQRFKDFKTPFAPDNARPALFAFKGDVYEPLELADYGKKELSFAQNHVRILSGLYGLLRPLDLMQAYRLEMGRKLSIGKTKDLYGFWGVRLSEALNEELSNHSNKLVLNLASEEYAKALARKALAYPCIDVVFKEKQGDKLKIIGLFAKQARGLMTNFIIKNQIDDVKSLRKFDARGYQFTPALSNDHTLTFIRPL